MFKNVCYLYCQNSLAKPRVYIVTLLYETYRLTFLFILRIISGEITDCNWSEYVWKFGKPFLNTEKTEVLWFPRTRFVFIFHFTL